MRRAVLQKCYKAGVSRLQDRIACRAAATAPRRPTQLLFFNNDWLFATLQYQDMYLCSGYVSLLQGDPFVPRASTLLLDSEFGLVAVNLHNARVFNRSRNAPFERCFRLFLQMNHLSDVLLRPTY